MYSIYHVICVFPVFLNLFSVVQFSNRECDSGDLDLDLDLADPSSSGETRRRRRRVVGTCLTLRECLDAPGGTPGGSCAAG